MGKVCPCSRSFLEFLPILVLFPIVEGDGDLCLRWQSIESKSDRLKCSGTGLVFELGDEYQASFALNKCIDTRLVVFGLNSITFPVTNSRSLSDHRRAHVYRNAYWSEYSLAFAHALWHTTFVATFEIWAQIKVSRLHDTVASSIHHTVYVLVDGFVRDRLSFVIDGQSTGDLFGRVSGNQMFNDVSTKETTLQAQFAATALSFCQSSFIGQSRTIRRSEERRVGKEGR